MTEGDQTLTGSYPLKQLARLLALAYLRLVASRRLRPEIAQEPAPQESPTGRQIGVDVAGEAMAQLDRERHP